MPHELLALFLCAGLYEVVIKTVYDVTVTDTYTDTDAPAFITLHGSAGTSPKPPIGDKGQSSADMPGPMFEEGYLDRFTLQLDNSVGDISKVALSLEPALLDLSADWKVDWVRLTDMHTRRAWKFCADQWISGPPGSDWTLKLDKACAMADQQGTPSMGSCSAVLPTRYISHMLQSRLQCVWGILQGVLATLLKRARTAPYSLAALASLSCSQNRS
jgi:hypothetical protein